MHTSPVPIDGRLNPAKRRCGTWPLCPPPRRDAFTLLELVIVLLILGIMAAMAVPTFFDSLLYHRVESAALRVKADVEQLRTTAQRTSKTQTMTLGESSYTLPPEVVGLEHVNDSYTVDLLKAPYQLESVSIEFDDSPTLSFDGYGMPTLGGSFVLQAGDYFRTVTLDKNTGETTISNAGGP